MHFMAETLLNKQGMMTLLLGWMFSEERIIGLGKFSSLLPKSSTGL